MSSVTVDNGSKVPVATNRLLFEFTSFSDRFYDALEFAHKALTELGVILSIDESDRRLSESGRDMIKAQVALIPLARVARPTEQTKNDARKSLDGAWGVLSSQLCCALEFALHMIDAGVYDFTFSRAFNLIQLSNEGRKKAIVKYIDINDEQACKIQTRQVESEQSPSTRSPSQPPVVHGLTNMINCEHPAKGEHDEHFPEKPTNDDFEMYGFVSRMMTPYMDKDPAIRAPYKEYSLVKLLPDIAELTQEFGWQLRAPHWYGDEIMDCFSMLLNLEQHTVVGSKKTWFWGPPLSRLLYIHVETKDLVWAGKWDEMNTIAVLLNAFDVHYFLMVISFDYRKVYILDDSPFRVYQEMDVRQKIEFIHHCMNARFREYRGNHDITKWPVEWPLKLSKQINPMDSGAYVCFFMDRLMDLIPTPKRRIFVNEDYLRVWVAKRICLSDFNKVKEDLLESFEEFKNELNRRPRAKNTPSFEAKDDENDELSAVAPDREQYNKVDYPEVYSDAKFFVIKSYTEDDVLKSIDNNKWSSTPDGNLHLDIAYQTSQRKQSGSRVFLFFSVNGSSQFVGVAEMTGPVNFHYSYEYWINHKLIGYFPVKWHILKDVSNSLLDHITLENNDNEPVTNSRDTQEVKLDQGLQILKIFKETSSKTCILERRQKTIQEKKAKQQFQKQARDNQPQTENVDAEVVNGGVNVQDANLVESKESPSTRSPSELVVVPGPADMINCVLPAKGEHDKYFPEKPSNDDFEMYDFVSRMMTPNMDEDPDIREPYKEYPLFKMLPDVAEPAQELVKKLPDVAELTREFGWQLRAPHWYGNEIMDCFSMLLNLEQHTVVGRKKTWFWGSPLSQLLYEHVETNDLVWAEKWDEMNTIAVLLNAFYLHYFLMVISFDSNKVYILDASPFCFYEESHIHQKIQFIHDCMNARFREYRGNHDITKWPVEWPLKLSKQINSMDSGAYVCFFMDRLMDLIPTPKHRIFVNEDYLRVWVAKRICLSDFNKVKEDLLESFEEFKNELNRRPRATNTPSFEAKDDENDELSAVAPNREQYNKVDFPEVYSDAKFFVIKSYTEDDVLKSIDNNKWSSTPEGNFHLDIAYQTSQRKQSGSRVFLFFSVNGSSQFVGVAEMTGPVNFHYSYEYWINHKLIGYFPVKWHILKDVSNSLLDHITLENNENEPVTNSRDTQEVKFDQGLQILKIFKETSSKTCILERRQKTIQEKKAKQQFQKQARDNQPQTENVDAEVVNGGVNVQDANLVESKESPSTRSPSELVVVPGPADMINCVLPAKGEHDKYFPEKPSNDDFEMYDFVSRMMTPNMDEDPDIREPYKEYPLFKMLPDVAEPAQELVKKLPDVAELTREFGWQLRAPHWYGNEIMDCFSMLLNLEQHTVVGRKKTWFWGSPLSQLLYEHVETNDLVWAEKWDEMNTIVVLLNAFYLHYFLMVISFDSNKVYILDASPFCFYEESHIHQKIQFIHDCMNARFREYRGNHDITKWPVEWPLKLSKQINSMDSGAYVCFFMDRLMDLIPTPKHRIFVNEDYLRVWVAKRICLSDFNKVKEDLLESFEEFKKSSE